MLSVKRFDPNAAAESSPAVKAPDDGLAALRARLDQRKLKRKREQEGEGVQEPAINKTVTFSNIVQAQEAPATAPTPTEPKEPASKTKAKARYLKNKKQRYKAHQKALPKEQRAGGPAPKSKDDEDNVDDAADPLRAARREERKAKRRAERDALAAEEGDMRTSSPVLEPLPVTEKPKKRKKRDREDADPLALSTANRDEDEPALPVGLERFPKPRKLVAPDRALLQELGVADELRDGVQIEPSLTVDLSALLSRTDNEPLVSSSMRQKLGNAEITSFFAVQAAVLPLLLEPRQLYPSVSGMPDLCVSAPTGSGKTLAYVLPIVETLSERIVTRLRALIVLPTRDLAEQVRETFVAFCQGTGLKVGSAGCSQHSFTREQELLTGGDATLHRGGLSNVDILIATPGRLLDHLKLTPNFTLQHLRFFVIDEADRLVGQSFNEWLPTVLEHLDSTTLPSKTFADAVAPHLLNSTLPMQETLLDTHRPPTVQKLLFSATLSRDPAQIAGLKLNNPIYVAVRDAGADTFADEAFTLPATLKEHMLTTPSSTKPLLLFHLLLNLNVDHALCFTKSIEAATRLVKLIDLFVAETGREAIRIASYSSDLPVNRRTKLLEAFKAGEIRLLVCSDLIARGMDIPHVAHVISYDVPIDMRKYVHRVGRTARAGRDGEAWSLVEVQEIARFNEMMTNAGRGQKVVRERVKKADLQKLQPAYEAALVKLRQAFVK